MQKSNYRQRHYRPGTSTQRGSVTTFRQQMADYAKGQVLRELRKRDGRSRETIASELGVTTKTLYSWENDGGIKTENAKKLARLYGIEDYTTLVSRDEDAGDQLDRIEGKLDRLLELLSSDDGAVGSADRLPDDPRDLPRLPATDGRRPRLSRHRAG